MSKWIDTTTESIERLKEARENLSRGVRWLLGSSMLLLFVGWILCVTHIYVIGLGVGVLMFGIAYLIVGLASVIKREIFSLAIILREKK